GVAELAGQLLLVHYTRRPTRLCPGWNTQGTSGLGRPWRLPRGSVFRSSRNEQECAMMQPGSSYGDSTRASDADRADVCAILDNAYAGGELDPEEHRQRCSSAMSAKTRGQLLEMMSDLQARPPVFSQQPANAVKANPNRKWIVGLAVGGALAAGAIVGLFATWHSGSSPSPTAPVAAPTASHSSETTGTFFASSDLVA